MKRHSKTRKKVIRDGYAITIDIIFSIILTITDKYSFDNK